MIVYSTIPLVQRIMNATVNSRTQVAPYQLLFGSAINLDRGIFLTHEELNKGGRVSRRMSKILRVQDELINYAAKNIKDADDAHIASAPKARTEFDIDSYVLLDYPDRPPTRLHAKRRGPYQVVRFHKNDYTIRDLITNKEKTVNITRLTPFEYDSQTTDPRHVAAADQEEFEIDSILAHRGNHNQKSTLEFLVRWVDYDDSYNTWEPWSALRTTEQLHEYLKSKGLEKLIPKEFR